MDYIPQMIYVPIPIPNYDSSTFPIPKFKPLPFDQFIEYPFSNSEQERLEDLNPYVFKHEPDDDHICDIEITRQKACKLFEVDIIGLGQDNKTVEPGKLKLKDRVTLQPVNTNLGQLLSEWKEEQSKQVKLRTTLTVLTVISLIAIAILLIIGWYLLSAIVAGGAFALMAGSYGSMIWTTEATKQLGLNAPLEAQDYYIKGPLEVRTAKVNDAYHDQIVTLQHSQDDDASKKLEELFTRIQIYEFHAQAMQSMQSSLKKEDPAKYARIIAKIFQGRHKDHEVLEYRKTIKDIYDLNKKAFIDKYLIKS